MTEKPDNSRIIENARHLIQQIRTMTLATSDSAGSWAAPVYFVNRGSGFYFFSSPNSRHVTESLSSGHAASTIYREEAHWQQFTGLQMAGRITSVSDAAEASGALFAYVKKFPLIKTFFPGKSNIRLPDFFQQFRAAFYCFEPDVLFFMDNSVEFGFRKQLNKDTLFT